MRKSSYLIRRFSVLYLVFALVPLLVLLFTYLQTNPDNGIMEMAPNQLEILIVLAAFSSLLGYFAMRRVLVKISFLAESTRQLMMGKVDHKIVLELVKEEGEVAELAQSFHEIVSRLESNIGELETTKEALHRTLSQIARAVSSVEDFSLLVNLVLETTADALGAKNGAVFSYSGSGFVLECSLAQEVLDGESAEEHLMSAAKSHLNWTLNEQRILVLPIMDGNEPGDSSLFQPPLVCAPLIYRGKFRGAILLSGSKYDRNFSSDQLKMISNLGYQLATLFENAELSEERERTYFETMATLALAVEARDAYSCGHSKRVSQYAERMGQMMGLSGAEIQTLRDAAPLHDIGKIGIADSILNKPGALTPEEYSAMKRHPEIGENIVKPLKTFQDLLEPIRHHHEFLDGSGYPDGLKADEIPLVTRIMTVADIFDALTSDRPYRNGMTEERALQILNEMVDEGKLDSSVVATLESLLCSSVGEARVDASSPEPGLMRASEATG